MSNQYIQGEVLKQFNYNREERLNAYLCKRNDGSEFVYKVQGVRLVKGPGDTVKGYWNNREEKGNMVVYSLLDEGTYVKKEGETTPCPPPVQPLSWDTCVLQAGMAIISTDQKFDSEADFLLASTELACQIYEGQSKETE